MFKRIFWVCRRGLIGIVGIVTKGNSPASCHTLDVRGTFLLGPDQDTRR